LVRRIRGADGIALVLIAISDAKFADHDLGVIEADLGLLARVQEEKRRAQAERVPPLPPGPTGKEEGGVATEFQMGQVVVLRSEPGMTGAVVGVYPGEPENRHKACRRLSI
jgi:hypothetical protein